MSLVRGSLRAGRPAHPCASNSRRLQCVAVLYLATALFGTASSGAEPKYQHGISFFHELKYPADFSHFDYINAEAPKGGVLVQSTQSDFNTLSLITDQSVTAPGVNWIYDSLVSYRSEEMSSFYGWLADGLSVADDKRTLFIRLHPRARWHDGVPVTARDVKFTIELIQSSLRFRGFLSWLRSVEILGEREVALRLDGELTVSNIFPLSWFPILPAHYWEERDPGQASLEPPLGSGPYKVAEVRQGRQIRYERVPDYWGRDIAVNKGRFNFDQIRYEVYRDATVAREAFRKGLFDTWFEPDIRYWATGYDIPARDRGWLVMDHLDHREEIGVNRVIALNNRRERFKDPRVREALTLAVDFEWENRVLRFGLLDRALSNFSGEPSLEAQGLPGEDELALLAPFRDQLPERLFTEVFEFPRSTGIGRNRASLERARALLAQSGWRVEDGVLVDSRGEPFEIEFLSVDGSDQRTLLPYLATLKLLGISGRIRLVDAAQFVNLRQGFDYDAIITRNDILAPPIVFLSTFFHSQSASQAQSANASGIADPIVDALIAEAVKVTTLEDMATVCRALDRVLLWGFYQIPLDAIAPFRIVYWNKFGRPEREDMAIYKSPFPDGWWYDESKAAQIEISR